MFNFFKILSDEEALLTAALQDTAYLVDVRSPEEFSTGSVEGAVNIPLPQIPERLDAFKDKKQVIVFCRSGHRSDQAKKYLTQNGIEDVLNGGSPGHLNKLIS